MVKKILRGGGGFHHTPVRREIAAQHKRAALGLNGIFHRANDIVVNQLRIGNILSDGSPGNSWALAMQLVAELSHQRAQTARVVKILQPIIIAVGPHIGEHWRGTADAIEILQRNI